MSNEQQPSPLTAWRPAVTTNKPEVKAWIVSAYVPYSGFQRHVCMSEDDVRQSRATFKWLRGEVEEVPLVSLRDYEALQAKFERVCNEQKLPHS